MSLSDAGHPNYHCPDSPAAWTPTTAKTLAALATSLVIAQAVYVARVLDHAERTERGVPPPPRAE